MSIAEIISDLKKLEEGTLRADASLFVNLFIVKSHFLATLSSPATSSSNKWVGGVELLTQVVETQARSVCTTLEYQAILVRLKRDRRST